jgi:hypothetical protein
MGLRDICHSVRFGGVIARFAPGARVRTHDVRSPSIPRLLC